MRVSPLFSTTLLRSAVFTALSIITLPAAAIDTNAILGGAIGGGTGAAVGSAVGGRNGAIVGSAAGAAVGTAISTSGSRSGHDTRYVSYDDEGSRHDYGRHRGHHKHHDEERD